MMHKVLRNLIVATLLNTIAILALVVGLVVVAVLR